ncbi:hypothetical protein ABPG72_019678 [Tetrahymena utriculariae]
MGCCQTLDSRPPYSYIQQPQLQFQQVKEKRQQVVVEPTFISSSNVAQTKQKDIRLERLMQEQSFVEDYRCDFIINYLVIDNIEQYHSVRGDLYLFDRILYFYCPAQTQVHPYGEFIKYMEKDQLKLIIRQTNDIFRFILKNDQEFMFKVCKQSDLQAITDRLVQIAKQLGLVAQL